jgi:hypothetical protein
VYAFVPAALNCSPNSCGSPGRRKTAKRRWKVGDEKEEMAKVEKKHE